MDSVKPPTDAEQRNIIDKLADFVARNGQEFELLTKDKQRDNPKFAFLQGGEYYDYYLHRVQEARKRWQNQRPMRDNPQQNMDHGFHWNNMVDQSQWDQMSNGPEHWQRFGAVPSNSCGWNGPDPSWYPNPSWACGPFQQGAPHMYGPPMPNYPYHQPSDNCDAYRYRNYGNKQYDYSGSQHPYPVQSYPYGQDSHRDYRSGSNYPSSCGSEFTEVDIEQSENNLKAQHRSLMTRQDLEIHEFVDKKREEAIRKMGDSLNMRWDQMNEVIQPLIEACTKENISKGKTWVVEKMAETPELTKLMSEYLITRASASQVTFELRLHLVYLLNDLLHHCKRRGAPTYLQDALQNVVPVVFCLTAELADDEQKAKINRVLTLWETNSYLPPDVLSKMRPPEMTKFLAEWKEQQLKLHEAEIDTIKTNIKNQYATLERQHQEFADHVHRQLAMSHSDNLDESTRTTINHPGQFGILNHMPQHAESNFNYWSQSRSSGVYDIPPPKQDMMTGMDNNNNRDCHGRMSMLSHNFPPNSDNSGGQNYHHHMGWSGRSNWGQTPPFHSQAGSVGSGSTGCHREMSSNVYVEGEENEDERPNYDSSYDCGQYDGYYSEYNRFDEPEREIRSSGDSNPRRRHNRPSRFSSSNDQMEVDDDRTKNQEQSSESESDNKKSGDSTVDLTAAAAAAAAAAAGNEPFVADPKCQPWQLPAGLMHKLIRLRDFDFIPIDGRKLRLLPPTPPSQRLLSAIENFYMPPSHERPRDGEGWERLALHEFFARKEKARHNYDLKRERSNNRSHRRRRHYSGGSGVTSPDEDQMSETGTYFRHDGSNSRDDSNSSNARAGSAQMSYLPTYPKSAVGQSVRTGSDALVLNTQPMLCMQGQLTQNYSAYKTSGNQPQSGQSLQPGVVPPNAPPGFQNANFLQFPPPMTPGLPSSINQPPPFPPGMLQRPPPSIGSGLSTERGRMDSRRSRSGSRSDSGSKSRSRSGSRSRGFRSRSGSRSRSAGSCSRSRSDTRSDSRGSRSHSRSPSPRQNTNNTSQSRGYSRNRRNERSRSNSRHSSSPFTRFTSAPGPGGINPGANNHPSGINLSAARAAAAAAAASISNSINSSHHTQSWTSSGSGGGGGGGGGGGMPNHPHTSMGYGGGQGILQGGPYGDARGMGSYRGGYPQGPPNRGMPGPPLGNNLGGGYNSYGQSGRGRMRYHQSGSDDMYYQQSRDYHRR